MTDTETQLVQVSSYRGFSFKINPREQGEMTLVTVTNLVTGEVFPPVMGNLAAEALVNEELRKTERR